MSEIRVDLDGVENLVRAMRQKAEKILRMRSQVAKLKNTLSDDVLKRRGIRGSIDRISGELEREHENVMRLLDTVQYGVNRYRETDEALLRLFQEQTGMANLVSNSSYFRESGEKPVCNSLGAGFPFVEAGVLLGTGNGTGSRPESNNFGKEQVEVDWLTYLKHVEPRRSEYKTTGEYAQAMENWQRDYNRAKRLSEPIDRKNDTTSEYAKEMENRESLEKKLFRIYGPRIDAEIKEINSAAVQPVFQASDASTVSGKCSDPEKYRPQNGTAMDYHHTTYTPRYKQSGAEFFGNKSSPQYAVLGSPSVYTDSNHLRRYSKVPGVKDNKNDYYCMAVPPGFAAQAEAVCENPDKEGNVNFGYTMKYTFQDENGKDYNMEVVIVDTKASSDPNDTHPHSTVIEFEADPAPGKGITAGGSGNVSLDALTGGKDVHFVSAGAYKNGALWEGAWKENGWHAKK